MLKFGVLLSGLSLRLEPDKNFFVEQIVQLLDY